ncbi:MAG: hypothetical protein ACREHG_04395, partial [Candidatus Saccharimonadales bacterium]
MPVNRRVVSLLGQSRSYETLNLIELNRGRVLANVDYVRALHGQAVIPVIKSNAYGHGLIQ